MTESKTAFYQVLNNLRNSSVSQITSVLTLRLSECVRYQYGCVELTFQPFQSVFCKQTITRSFKCGENPCEKFHTSPVSLLSQAIRPIKRRIKKKYPPLLRKNIIKNIIFFVIWIKSPLPLSKKIKVSRFVPHLQSASFCSLFVVAGKICSVTKKRLKCNAKESSILIKFALFMVPKIFKTLRLYL